MTDAEFIRQLVINATKPIAIGAIEKELFVKFESIVILQLLKSPTYILGPDDYKGNKFDYTSYDVKYFSILTYSTLFVDFMYRFRNRFRLIFTLCQLDKLRDIFEIMECTKHFTTEYEEKINEILIEIECILAEEKTLTLLDIQDNPIEFLYNYPNTFFKYMNEMDLLDYCDCILNNDFVDTIANLSSTGFEFREEQLQSAITILEQSIKLYERQVFNMHAEVEETGEMAEVLRDYFEYEDYEEFDYDYCCRIYQELENMLDTKQRNI